MSQFRDYLNEVRNSKVPTEFRIALGQLKRMYNKDETPDLSELEKDAEMIAKKNKLDVNKFLELAKSEFKINEASIKYVIGKKDGKVLTARGNTFKFTDNYNLAYTFDSAKEAIEYEDKHANDIDGFTYIYTLINGKLKLNESAVGSRGRTTEKDAEDHIDDALVAEFKKIIKKLGGKTVAKVLLDKLSQKPEIKDEIEHIEDLIDNSNY